MNKLFLGDFPTTRLRRNRQNLELRELLAENYLKVQDLILPIFIVEGQSQKQEIKSLPDVYRYSIDLAVKRAKEAKDLGIKAIMIFAVIDEKLKTANGEEALNKNNLTCRAIAEIKNKVPEILVIADVALDPYTNHGHDGIINKKGQIDNDATIEILCKQALVQSQSGADANAPSDMMDGRIGEIRKFLDKNNFSNNLLISYSAKYASNLYGPFRNALNSLGTKKLDNVPLDKKTYQMDFCNSNEALNEIALDIKEGADMIIVKPATFYLDIISKTKNNFNIPIISYQVSGEYAMLKYASQNGVFNFEDILFENLIAQKRAGATAIITYGAIEMAKILQKS